MSKRGVAAGVAVLQGAKPEGAAGVFEGCFAAEKFRSPQSAPEASDFFYSQVLLLFLP